MQISPSARRKDYPANDLDFVTFFDCLHDMGDPTGAAAHVRQSLKPDGSWMIVEPMAGDKLEDNLNPIGRIYYAASTLVCVPTSLAQEVGTALGAQAGEARLRGGHHCRRVQPRASHNRDTVQYNPGGTCLINGGTCPIDALRWKRALLMSDHFAGSDARSRNSTAIRAPAPILGSQLEQG